MADNKSALRNLVLSLGFDEKETDVYLAMLPLGPAPASDIAVAAKIRRPTAYFVLDRLLERGLISSLTRDKVQHYVAEPPRRLVRIAQERQQELKTVEQNLLRSISQLEKSAKVGKIEPPAVTFLQGMEGLREVYRDILVHPFLGIVNPKTMYATFGTLITDMLFKDTTFKGRDLLVDCEEVPRHLHDAPPSRDYAVRILPKDCAFDSDTLIMGDIVAHFAFDREISIIRIQHAGLAATHRAWFEQLWAVSREPPRSVDSGPKRSAGKRRPAADDA